MNAPARNYDLPDYLTPAHIANLPGDLQSRFTRLMSFVAKSSAQRQFYDLFPDSDITIDGQTIYARDRYLKHIEFFDAGANYRERCFLAANRVGKAQPNDEPVLTPRGFVPMGSLRIGDEVIGSDGKPVRVLGVYPQGRRRIVRLLLSDGSSVRCDVEHLWNVRRVAKGRVAPFLTYETRVLADMLAAGERLALPERPLVEFDQAVELPVDPYLLGLLIGDGGLSTGTVLLTTDDPEIIEYAAQLAGEYGCVLRKCGKQTYQFATVMKRGGRHMNVLADLLDGLGLRGKTSHHKRIPPEYLIASSENRLALLRGLMDTDGSCGENGARAYYSVSEALCRDVAALARSLGLNAAVSPKNGRYNGEIHRSWKVQIARSELSIFGLPRKKQREIYTGRTSRGLLIEAIEPDGEAECTCIQVAAPDQLYITTDFVVTHNTFAGAYEMTCHLTGLYPHWWRGRRFDAPILAWACGKSGETTRDIVQNALLGDVTYEGSKKGVTGSGMIPGGLLGRPLWKSSGGDALDTIIVKHVSGGWSKLSFKAYEQGRGSFEGTAKHVIWLDEECPLDVYGECVIRTATTGGIIMLTFTPLEGMTDTVMQFMLQPDF